MTRVCLSPSQQEHNIGVGSYGTEAARCRRICIMAAALLEGVPNLTVRVVPDYTKLDEPADYLAAVRYSNAWGADEHIAVHTNAGGAGADGTDTFYLSAEGKRLAAAIQRRVGAVSPGSDGGIHQKSGWAELASTSAVACLIELAFHTDEADAVSVIAQPGLYAAALADGVCDYLGIKRTAKPKATVPAAYKKAKDAFTKLPLDLREKFLKWAPKWRVGS